MSSYAPRTAAREKLVLQAGKPVTIALEFSTGKLVQSSIPGAPQQVYYTLTDGRCWYADLGAAELLEGLDLASREPFTVCKLGAGRYEVQRAGRYPTEPQRTTARSGERAAAPPTAQPMNEAANNSLNESTSQPSTKLEQALKTAILASCNAEKYATEIGYTVRFTPEAIKCMAISVLIGMEQGGRR